MSVALGCAAPVYLVIGACDLQAKRFQAKRFHVKRFQANPS